jgi:1,4-dihydroxy-6-naphthoate synthase
MIRAMSNREQPRVQLLLAHSPDPDDAFMWWPITGRIEPPSPDQPLDGTTPARVLEPPSLDCGRFAFSALPADIEALNRRALQEGDLDITALSVRTWADVQDRYALTACGASFGDGFGPRLVARTSDLRILCEECLSKPRLVIAVPGRGTTAFLMLGLMLRELRHQHDATGLELPEPTFIEMPFEQIIGAVADGAADVGLIIHEGQLSFADAGLCKVADVGAWWKQKTGLMLPLGVNALRRDLDQRFGPGTLQQVADILKRSVAYAMERWDESVHYTLGFAQANAARTPSGRGHATPATLERIDQYCRMYVSPETLDMGDTGREAIRRLLAEGAAAGLCPGVGHVDVV